MRLYLSSYRLGDHSERLVEMAGGGRVAVIGNALDYIPEASRRTYAATVYDPIAEFAALGLAASELDLRAYFRDRQGLARALENVSLVWALGGNAFLLMRAIAQSGLADILAPMLQDGRIAYGGFSAGAVVATPHLRGIELMDDPDRLVAGYSTYVVWEGMGLVDFSIVPHYRSDHPDAAAASQAVAVMEAKGLPYLALSDGEVYVVDNDAGTLLPRR